MTIATLLLQIGGSNYPGQKVSGVQVCKQVCETCFSLFGLELYCWQGRTDDLCGWYQFLPFNYVKDRVYGKY